MGSQEGELLAVLEPVVVSQGVGLVEVALVAGGRRPTLRIVIHSDGGVTHGDCTRVTRACADAVEDAGLLPGGYQLEVSSPGLRRVLKAPREFDVFRGQTVRVWVADTDEDTRTEIVGVAQGTRESEGVVLRTEDGRESVIPWTRVAKARLEEADAKTPGLGGKGR
jgi:ribosome maturation factor RimP